ncbi:MAG: hypothetical protein AB1589_09520 [Cyanobacteriota bacterium]
MKAIVDRDSLKKAKENMAYPFSLVNLNIKHRNSELRAGLTQLLREKQGAKLDPPLYIEPQPLWQALLDDLKQNIPKPVIAAKFHTGLANTMGAMVNHLCYQHEINQVVLTGSVFQNRLLLELVSERLEAMKITVLTHRLVLPNDGGLSLGQAVIAAAQLIER